MGGSTLDSKTKILNAALDLFIKEGFHGTSTSKIAKEAGISNGTLFYHFKTKEDLISKLYKKLKDDYRNYLLAHMVPCKTFKNRIKQLWFDCVQWNLDNSNCITFYAMFSNSPYIDNLSKKEASRNFDFMLDLFQEAINNEILLDVNVHLIMGFFVASVQATAKFVKDHPGHREEQLEQAFKMCWRSIANI
ncbi:transcriptional regulator TetR family [Acetobacterium woodii DSM 1030]|uniref:Transcriptional regulator TetR family n=1 Tax=Acetobacterium woodii (strain ATCC 29683 / DSM 1030 / JCM 2381 / KCTC 1655 / WB1) TaxID=931626 RepID=H6LK46_ACEWD|nr:transcriptional regulator TetR family [Acetobacterium woodii DSM 1030]